MSIEKEALDLIHKWFKNYPPRSMWDNIKECTDRIEVMAKCVMELREFAVERNSTSILREASLLDNETGGVLSMIQRTALQKQMQTGLVTAGAMPPEKAYKK